MLLTRYHATGCRTATSVCHMTLASKHEDSRLCLCLRATIHINPAGGSGLWSAAARTRASGRTLHRLSPLLLQPIHPGNDANQDDRSYDTGLHPKTTA